MLFVDTVIQKYIIDKADSATIRNAAIKNGMRTMMDDGLLKVAEGITTIDEVLRVTKE